jgi:SAM-dependent methyltransferase
VTLGQRLARVATDLTVRWPWLWPLFRGVLRRQFDDLAPRWDAFRSPESGKPFEAALDRVQSPVRDALDVGTGTGTAAVAVAERFPEASVVGVDVAAAMVEAARAKAPALRFEVADAAALPFGDATFDLVTHANAIPFFDEVARVLRPGGTAVFAYSVGDETPIYVRPEKLRAELAARGFDEFEEIAAGRGTAFVARKR